MKQHRPRLAILVLGLFLLTSNGAALASQQLDPRAINAEFVAAVRQFNSPQHELSADSFQKLIDTLSPHLSGLSDDLRTILARSLAYHAEVMLNTSQKDRALRDVQRLIQARPDFVADSSMSKEFVALLEEAKAATRPIVQPPPPRPRPTTPPVLPRSVPSPARPPEGTATAPRILLLRGNAMYQSQMEPFTSNAIFTLYNRPAQVEANYALGEKGAPDGYEFGATVRLWKYLSIGATKSRVSFPQVAAIEAHLPHPTFNFTRRVEGTITSINRTEEAFHVEIGASVGDDDFEVVVFIGPSWLSTTQNLITRVSILEESNGPSITGATGREQFGESRIGINVGIDGSWMFAKYVGVGVSGRYVRSDVEFDEMVSGVRTLVTGGGQVGFGARFRF